MTQVPKDPNFTDEADPENAGKTSPQPINPPTEGDKEAAQEGEPPNPTQKDSRDGAG